MGLRIWVWNVVIIIIIINVIKDMALRIDSRLYCNNRVDHYFTSSVKVWICSTEFSFPCSPLHRFSMSSSYFRIVGDKLDQTSAVESSIISADTNKS
jgi:hypothetical protein